MFRLETKIDEKGKFSDFLRDYNVGSDDLIVTNEYVLSPVIKKLPCDVIYQEKYGAGEPSDEMINAVLRDAGKKDYKRVIAVGGGTVIDICKLMVFENGLSCAEIFEKGTMLPKVRELIAIPTTCGTGSEVTNISIAEFKSAHTKKGLAADKLFPDTAVLIAELLYSLPHSVFAASSIDALIHALESYIAPKANAFTRLYAREAIELIIYGYRSLKDVKYAAEERNAIITDFMTASCFAGIAFMNTGVGAVHALSYPLGAVFHIPHGRSNYLMLSGVFAHYVKKGADISCLEEILCGALECEKDEVWGELTALLDTLLSRAPLHEEGMSEAQIDEFAVSVIEQQQRLLKNNPVPFDVSDVKEIYKKLF